MTKKATTAAVVSSAVAAFALALGAYLTPVPTLNSISLSPSIPGVSLNESTIVVGHHPITLFVGAFTGNRAVIQIEAKDDANLSSMISRARLLTQSGDITPAPPLTARSKPTRALTLTFKRSRPIGSAQLSLEIEGRTYSFRCEWPNG